MKFIIYNFVIHHHHISWMVWIKCCDKFCHMESEPKSECGNWGHMEFVFVRTTHTRKRKHISNAKQYELFLYIPPAQLMHSVLCICKRFVVFFPEWNKANYYREIGHAAAARRRTIFAAMHILAYGQKYLRIHFLFSKPNLCWIDCGKRNLVCVPKFNGALSIGRNMQPHTKRRISSRGGYFRPGQLTDKNDALHIIPAYIRRGRSTAGKTEFWAPLEKLLAFPFYATLCFVHALYVWNSICSMKRVKNEITVCIRTAYIIIMGHWAMPSTAKD